MVRNLKCKFYLVFHHKKTTSYFDDPIYRSICYMIDNKKIPIVMVLSSGYSSESVSVIQNSLSNLCKKLCKTIIY